MLVSDNAKAEEIVKELSDEYSRKIITSIITESLPIEEISRRTSVPVSTCYRRMHMLFSSGLVRADKTIIQGDGKKFICYKSTIKNATIQMESEKLLVDLVSNRDPSEKLRDMWSAVKSVEPSRISREINSNTASPNLLPRTISPLINTTA